MHLTRLRLRPVATTVLLIMAALFFQPNPAGGEPRVATDKDRYRSGEQIQVHFSGAPGEGGDWICIVPAGSPDTEAGDYRYMPDGASQGDLTFDAPPPGSYEARAYYDYRRNGYVVSARCGFSVGLEPAPAPPAPPVAVPERTTPVASPPVEALPLIPSRISAAVFHFMSSSMDASQYAGKVLGTLTNAPRMQASFDLLDRRDLETFLVANDLHQTDHTEDVITIGTRLGLNVVITGSIEKRGTLIITHYKVISIDQRRVIFTDRSVSLGEASLVSDVVKMSDVMIEAILRSAS
jgi:TolB-like protein